MVAVRGVEVTGSSRGCKYHLMIGFQLAKWDGIHKAFRWYMRRLMDGRAYWYKKVMKGIALMTRNNALLVLGT